MGDLDLYRAWLKTLTHDDLAKEMRHRAKTEPVMSFGLKDVCRQEQKRREDLGFAVIAASKHWFTRSAP